MADPAALNKHYGADVLDVRAHKVLVQFGLDSDDLDWSELSRLDQFHSGGLESTKALAALLRPEPDDAVLDVGSGLGGPARFLAATIGCSVTGIDMNPAFIRVATDFSHRSGLTDKTTFVEGDALAMPFADGSFDAALTQHVAMNIHNRAGLYAEIRRVLKPGARFAIHDIVVGEGQTVDYPMPWASTFELSHLVTAAEMKSLVTAAGFEEASFADVTERAKAFFAQQQQLAQQGASQPANLLALIGPDFAPALANLTRQVLEGKVSIVMALYTAT